MSNYKIKKLQYEKAKELKVKILRATNPNKKLDVFVGGKKVSSIGANKSINPKKPMNDYATYLEKLSKAEAEKKRMGYVKRHSKEPKIKDGKYTPSFYADELLWGKKGEAVNQEIKYNKKIIGDIEKKIKDKEKKKLVKEKKKKPKKK
tara:strand:+ start:7930 stop:8373 length:444 start_codon:yes stop_codon:yes gene_type:complete